MMFVGYTMTTKQYHLYNPKTRTFVKLRKVVFYKDTPFFQQTAEQVFMPLTKKEEKVHPVTIKSESNGPVTRRRAKIESEGGGEAGTEVEVGVAVELGDVRDLSNSLALEKLENRPLSGKG